MHVCMYVYTACMYECLCLCCAMPCYVFLCYVMYVYMPLWMLTWDACPHLEFVQIFACRHVRM